MPTTLLSSFYHDNDDGVEDHDDYDHDDADDHDNNDIDDETGCALSSNLEIVTIIMFHHKQLFIVEYVS